MSDSIRKDKSKKEKQVIKEYPTYQGLVGQAAKVADPEDDEVKEITVVELGEYDDNGVPHTAVCQLRRAVTRIVVDPKDIELIEGNGFESGF